MRLLFFDLENEFIIYSSKLFLNNNLKFKIIKNIKCNIFKYNIKILKIEVLFEKLKLKISAFF